MAEKKKNNDEMIEKDENIKIEVLEIAIEAYKKSASDLKWAITILCAVFIASFAYVVFRSEKEYNRAVDDAKHAAREAATWNQKAEEQFALINEEFEKIKNEVLVMREEIKEEINKEAVLIFKEIKKKGDDVITGIVKREDEERRIIDLWRKGSRALDEGDYELSLQHWEEIVEIDPNDYRALHNWGLTLALLAKTKRVEEVNKYFVEAYEKFERVLNIDPNNSKALAVWGSYLSKQAKEESEDKADDLFDESYEKFMRALNINPGFYEVLCEWGVALSEQALRKKDNERDELFGKSYQKFEQATHVKPDGESALYLWGNVLFAHALGEDGVKADNLYEKACEKYEKALFLKPNDYYALANWGNALKCQAISKKGEEAEELIAQACNKFLRAFAVDPHKPEALDNWGDALLHLAHEKKQENKTEEADALTEKACEKLEMAVNREPRSESFRKWGNAFDLKAAGKRLRVWGKKVKATERLLAQACEKYEMAVALDPDDYITLERWANVLLYCAVNEKGKNRGAMLEEAKKKCLLAESIKTGWSAYRLACISAALGDESECKRWLKVGEGLAILPPKDVVNKEDFLKSMRNKKWFKEIRWNEE